MNEHKFLFNILDYGAIGDGRTKNTHAIARTIEACKASGGGTIWVPAGRFLTGPIVLDSNMTLHVDAGAVLLFSQDFEDYPTVRGRWGGVVRHGHCPCVFAENAENISVTGRGTIDGQGQAWWKLARGEAEGGFDAPMAKKIAEFDQLDMQLGLPDVQGYQPGDTCRPALVRFQECRNVLIQGVTLTNSPFWTVHPVFCQNVTIHAITVKNPPNSPNTDGINPDSCFNVRISDCYVDVGDDCVTIKSGYDEDGRRIGRPCENITVTNCTMIHGHGGVVIGSEMSGGVRNVVISNCIFDDTYRGIRIKSRRWRGGVVEDVRVSNIIMRRVLCPFVMNLYYSCGGDRNDKYLFGKQPEPVNEGTPLIRNIHFSDITARDIRGAAGFFYGLPERPIEGITFNNVRICMDPQETEGGYPAAFWGLDRMVGRGFICTNVKNMEFNNIEISARNGPALSFDQACDVEVVDLRAAVAQPEVPAVSLIQTKRAVVRNSRLLNDGRTFCRISGSQTADITLVGNQAPFTETSVILAPDVSPAEVVIRESSISSF